MYEQWDVKDHLMPGKRDFRETVLLLAAHPAREAYEASHNPSLPTVTETGQLSAVQQSVSSAETNLLAVSLDAFANVKHFFTLLGKMFFTSYGKEFFIYHGKQIFTSQGKHLFTRYGKQTLSSAQPCG